jgi:hypothetical protein
LEGFKVRADSFVRRQTTVATYTRCRQYHSTTNDAKVYWQYYPTKSWLARWKVTLVADDKAGLSYEEIDTVLEHCRYYRFLLIEIAIDFSPSSGVDGEFVRRHAIFGKTRRNKSKMCGLYWGGRKCGKLVRCYRKKQLRCYRIELELHSRFLRDHIKSLDDVDAVAVIIHPRHFQFVDVDWESLERHLRQKHHAHKLIAGAKRRLASLSRLRRYLRKHGVKNFHRFLVPLQINEKISRAFTRWMRDFQDVA